MRIETSGNYTTTHEWFQSVLRDRDVVLCHTSALECLGLFPGYVNEDQIDVYTTTSEFGEIFNQFIVDNYEGIEVVDIDGIRCTSLNQTINDMLRDYDIIDEQSLAQALAGYYYSNGESFDGIRIEPQYAERFNAIRDWAVEFYNYD
jgi:hypothetical protein